MSETITVRRILHATSSLHKHLIIYEVWKEENNLWKVRFNFIFSLQHLEHEHFMNYQNHKMQFKVAFNSNPKDKKRENSVIAILLLQKLHEHCAGAKLELKMIFSQERKSKKNFSICIKANDVLSLVLLLRISQQHTSLLSTTIMKIDGVVNNRNNERENLPWSKTWNWFLIAA